MPVCVLSSLSAPPDEDGNDFVFISAVEKDSLIAVLWHFSCFANLFFISLGLTLT